MLRSLALLLCCLMPVLALGARMSHASGGYAAAPAGVHCHHQRGGVAPGTAQADAEGHNGTPMPCCLGGGACPCGCMLHAGAVAAMNVAAVAPASTRIEDTAAASLISMVWHPPLRPAIA
jgi:hypothetical protein